MKDDLPDFVGGEPTPAPEPVAAPAAAPETPVAAPAATVAPDPAPAAPAAPVADLGHHVPLPTFLDLRDKFTAAEKEAKELRDWRQQQEAQARRAPVPDRDEDPDGYEAHRQAAVQGELYDQRLDMSRFMAEQRHGQQVVEAAYAWGLQRCDQDPHFNAKVASSRDPVGVVVAEWRRDQVASKVDPTKYDAFLAWEATQAGAAPQPGQPQPAAAPAAPMKPVAPRPSLAGGPSAGDVSAPIPRDGEATFDRMFT